MTVSQARIKLNESQAEIERLTSEIEELKTNYFTCCLCGKLQPREKFYKSTDPLNKSGVTPICKKCAQDLAIKYDDDGNKYSTKKDTRLAMFYLNKPFLNSLWDSSVQESANENSGKKRGTPYDSYIKNVSMINYQCGKYGADGDFGSGSLASVKAFQRDNGLVADGLYGEATKAKLTTLYNAKIKAESASKPSSKPSTSSSKVAPAQSFNKSIAGTYKVKASNGLNLRYKPGDTSNSNLILTIPNGKSVANYGYYTTVNGVKWYLVTYKDTPGFVSSRYLVK